MDKKLGMKIYGFILMILLGIVYSYSVFRVNLVDHIGVSVVYSGFPYMFKLLFFSVSMGFSGFLFRKMGSLKIAIIGSVFVVIGFFISYLGTFVSGNNVILIMTIGYGLFIGLGIGPLYMLPLRVLSSNLDKNVGLWTGITLFGIGVSPLFFAPMIEYLFDTFNIFQVFMILGIAYGILLPFITFKLARMDETKAVKTTEEKSVLTNRHFYVVYALFFIVMFIGLTFIGLAQNIGEGEFLIEPHIMAFLVGIFSVFNGLGRPLAGSLIDRISIYKTSLISFISLLVIIPLCIFLIDSTPLFIIMMIIVYLNFGSWLSIAPISTRRLFGKENYSKHYGYMFSAYGISAFIGTWTSSAIFSGMGLVGLYILSIGLIFVGLIVAILHRRLLSI